MTRDDLVYLYPEFAETIVGYLAEDKEWMSRDALRGELIPTIDVRFVARAGGNRECQYVVYHDGSLWVCDPEGRCGLFMEVIRRL